jgi:hypothetical protein
MKSNVGSQILLPQLPVVFDRAKGSKMYDIDEMSISISSQAPGP